MNEKRHAPLDLAPDDFRRLGHALIDRIARHIETLNTRPITPGEAPSDVRELIGQRGLPDRGTDAGALLDRTADLLFDHSLFNLHPRFWGYITGSPAPLGMLGDLLAASVNPNVGAFVLSPVATEIEKQTVRWIADFIGFPSKCGGIMVSGGNMANMVAFLAARRARVPWDVRKEGLRGGTGQLTAYASRETHTWIQKAADLFGLGLNAIRWIDTDDQLRMDVSKLERAIVADQEAGQVPFIVIGTGGSVSTGAIDPLGDIAAVCKRHDIWFHVDGAYGAPAAVLPEASPDLKALALADSVAVDPHKWLYAPLEAGCTLVRDASHLADAYSFHPAYYHFDDVGDGEVPTNFHELGPQNSRGFRALKVWLGLQQAGRDGYIQMIRDDIAFTKAMYHAVAAHPELEPFTLGLSIATFRYVPTDLTLNGQEREQYLNELNTALVSRLQAGGELFVSNAVINGSYVLRACIVNFRTGLNDVQAVPEMVVTAGRAIAAELLPR
jgi:glutamate/tyrosine decarboxylase-like PLP-dependent enzyme